MKSAWIHSISARIALSSAGVLIIAVAIISTVISNSMSGIIREAEERELRGVFDNVKVTIESESRVAQAMSAVVAGIPQAQQAFADRDRDALGQLFVPGFSVLKKEYGVRQFQFHTPPATSFLRVHKPTKFGDDLSSFRKTVVETNNTVRPVGGIEKGVAGLGVRGMVPVVNNGQHVGSVEFGMSFGQAFFDQFKEKNKVDLALHVIDGAGFKTFASTFDSKTLLTPEQLQQAILKEVLTHKTLLGVDVAVYSTAVTDFSGKPFGVIEIVMDRSVYGNMQSESTWLNIILALLAVIGGVFVSAFVAKGIVKPIKSAALAMEDIAEGDGDLTQRLPLKGKDEITELSGAFNNFAEKVHALVGDVAEASTYMSTAAEDMSNVTVNLDGNVQKQRLEIDQVATAMNEMAATVQEVARSASEAANSAETAHSQSVEGKTVVGENIHAINALAGEVENAANVINNVESDSERIGTVLDVIRGIAEQTNLLALNAAIEAARAGEQGRGFAVVADEVRTLASRTQESTQEIQGMIESLQKGSGDAVAVMEKGKEQAVQSVKHANAAGDSLELITSAVSSINDMNTQIASAAEEQSAVAEEINRNVVNINDMAEMISDGSQQTAKSSNDLEALASQLQNVVSRFRI